MFSKPIIPGDGPLDADLWLIGRDGGATEERQGKPFVGRAGQILNDALGAAAIRRETIYIDNVVPVRPPNNKWEAHNPNDVVAGKHRLAELVAKHKPKLVVALGGEAAQALIGEDWPRKKSGVPEGIRDVRGYLFDTADTRVLATVHPAGCDREWVPWRKLLEVDLEKAKRELDTGCPPFPVRNVKIVTRIEELAEIRSAIQGVKWVAMDIENNAELKLSCLGIAVHREIAFVIPAVTEWQLVAIAEFCENNVRKIFQNGQYDRYFFQRQNGITVKRHVFDVMHAWHALQPELAGMKEDSAKKKKAFRKTEKSLRFFASVFTREPWYKNYDFADEQDKYILCGKDCCVTLEVADILERELERC